ncbi:unnamed protein product [Camellia sinensis]
MVGDPLEKVALKGIEWSYKSDEKAMPKNERWQCCSDCAETPLRISLETDGSCCSCSGEFLAFVKIVINQQMFVKQLKYALVKFSESVVLMQ